MPFRAFDLPQIRFNSRRLHRKPQRRLGFSSFVSREIPDWARLSAEIYELVPGSSGPGIEFLDINGVSLERDDERLYELTMAAAEGRADKQQLADQPRKLADEAQA